MLVPWTINLTLRKRSHAHGKKAEKNAHDVGRDILLVIMERLVSSADHKRSETSSLVDEYEDEMFSKKRGRYIDYSRWKTRFRTW